MTVTGRMESVERFTSARGDAGIYLVIDDVGLRAQTLSQCLRYPRSLLQRRAIGHINHDLKRALVVEGQHLHTNPLQRDERNRREQQNHCPTEKHPAAARMENQRVHDAAVEARGSSLGLMVALSVLFGVVPQQTQRSPGRDHKRHAQRKQHGCGRADRGYVLSNLYACIII